MFPRAWTATAIICLSIPSLLPTLAWGGTVCTISGDTFEGDTKIDAGAITVAIKGQPSQRVELANILRADLREAKADSTNNIEPGVQLRGGSSVSGKILGIDATAVHLIAAGHPLEVPLAEVARVVLAPWAEGEARKLPEGFVGAVLPGNDLYEGEFRGMDDKPPRVKINSPLLGTHRFALNGTDILALALHGLNPNVPPADYTVKAVDGSVYAVLMLQLAPDGLTLHDPVLGDVKIPAKQIAEIRAGRARVLPMGLLKAAGVGSVNPVRVPAAFTADAMPAGGPVTLAGQPRDGGIVQAAGVTVSYAMPAGFGIFQAQAGLPDGAAAGTAVVFSLLADGRPVWRGQPVAAGSAPQPVRWNLDGGVRILSLVVEPAQSASLGAVAIWGNATLLKP